MLPRGGVRPAAVGSLQAGGGIQPTVLTLKRVPPVPAEAGVLTPGNLRGRSRWEIEDLALLVGNREERVGEYFLVERGEDGFLRLEGDLRRFKRIGASMDGGTLEVAGPVGAHAGAGMRGGLLAVEGDAGDWLGAHMEGGKIVVTGNAGDHVGGAYPGHRVGMRGGVILVGGTAGHVAGARMRRGLVAIAGGVGDFAGHAMVAGTLLVWGQVGRWAGARMRRGTLMLFGPAHIPPTFRYSSLLAPPFWPVLHRYLAQEGFVLPGEIAAASFHRYSGDVNELAAGEILVWSGAGEGDRRPAPPGVE